MINQIKNIFNTILNKEGRGELTPTEFDSLLHSVQLDIFSGYLEEYKKSIRQNNKGLGGSNLADAKLAISSKLNPFRLFNREVNIELGLANLPKDIAYVNTVTVKNVPVNVLEHSLNRISLSDRTKPSEQFPVCVFEEGKIVFMPKYESSKAVLSGIRFPKPPKWTFREIGGSVVFNQSSADFQDVELHQSELPTIVFGLCSLMGVRLKELDITQIMENLKDKDFQKENM